MAEPRYYRIAPEYRRSLVYVMVGVFAMAPLAAVICLVIQQRPVVNAVVAGTGLVVLGLAALVPFHWLLRVDGRGLARRILWWWDLWDWTDLASGLIEKRHPYVLVDPRRPWWRRKLQLGYLTRDDLREVLNRINEHYRLPPPPPVPETLRIKCGLRRSVTFDRKGVTLLARGRLHAYRWDEIRRVHLRRMDPVRRDFASLEIFFPEDTIELKLVTHQGGTSPTWRGATAAEINQLLFQHLPAERIQEDVAGGPAATREDAERSLADARKRERGFSAAMGVMALLLAGALLWMAFDQGVLQALVMTLLSCGWFMPVVWFMHRDLRRRIRQLEAELAAFPETGEHVTTD